MLFRSHPKWEFFNYPTTPAGNPNIYTIVGGNLMVRPVDDTALSIAYRAKTAALSGALNWLYTNHPDAYLFGVLAEAYTFQREWDMAANWKGRRDEVFQSIKGMDFHYRDLGAMKVLGPTP